MPNTYIINVTNNSGNTQQYALFNETPLVSATVQPQVWNNALKVTPVGPGASATFTITSQYHAYVGSSNGEPGKDNVAVRVSKAEPVNLGSKDLRGVEAKGSTLTMDIIGGAPQFTGTADAAGKLNAFSINTAAGTDVNGFTFKNAKSSGWVIGLGKIVDGKTLAAATIVPQPSCKYQIEPVNTWYIAYGDFTSGQVCNIEMIGAEKATIDFTKTPSEVTVVHSEGGQITLQA